VCGGVEVFRSRGGRVVVWSEGRQGSCRACELLCPDVWKSAIAGAGGRA
jgi:hypothetical protein